MNHQDVIDLLAVIAAVDHRTIGKADVIVWHDLIGDLDKADAFQAAREHFREHPGVWLEPGHIVAGVRAIRRDRYDRMSLDERLALQEQLIAARQARKRALRVVEPPEPGADADTREHVIAARIAEHVQDIAAAKSIPDNPRQNGNTA